MRKITKKVICICFTVLMCTGVFLATSTKTEAAGITNDQIVRAALTIIRQNEGSYDSVVCNDGGAVSIGWIQWHGNRALNLLKSIVAANPSQAVSIIGRDMYNEITTVSDWSSRIYTASERTVTQALLRTSEGMSCQDTLAYNDISSYVDHGMTRGVTNPTTLVYYADLENQGGAGGARRVANAAVGLVNDDYSAITVHILHKAALLDASLGQFETRRSNTYTYCLSLGWESSTLSYSYEIWMATTYLNVRANAGTQATLVTGVSSQTNLLITQKVYYNGGTWGKSNLGWLSLDYCDYKTGNIKTPVKYDIGDASLPMGEESSFPVAALNSYRPADSIVIFDSSYGSNSTTNQYGGETACNVDGMVTYFGGYGSCNTGIPRDGMVVSGIGSGYDWLSTYGRGAYYLWFDENEMRIYAYNTLEGYTSQRKFAFYDNVYGYLPTPVKEGYTFLGWYDGNTADASLVTSSSHNMSHRTMMLYARFRETATTYVYFDTAGGSFDGIYNKSLDGVNVYRNTDMLVLYNGGSSTETNIFGAEAAVNAAGQIIAVYPYGNKNCAIPAGGFVLSGNGSMCNWITANLSVGEYVTADTTAKTITVYPTAEIYNSINKKVKEGSAFGALPSVSKEGHELVGWYTASGERITEDSMISGESLTLYASWQLKSGKISFDAEGGSISGAKATYTASGVNTARDGSGLVIYRETERTLTDNSGYEAAVNNNGTVVCVYPVGQGNNAVPEGGFILSGADAAGEWIDANIEIGDYVSLDGNAVSVYRSAGNCGFSSFTVQNGGTYGALPVPERGGYVFLGWYDANGAYVYEGKGVDYFGDMTLSAHWRKYEIVRFDANGGEIVGAFAETDAVGINIPSVDDSLAIYRGVGSTPSQSGGVEAVVGANGIVVSCTAAQSSTVPEGGFVLSASGDAAAWLSENVTPGRYVDVDGMHIGVYKNLLQYLAFCGGATYFEGDTLGGVPEVCNDRGDLIGWTDAAGNDIAPGIPLDINNPPVYLAKWDYSGAHISFDTDGGSLCGAVSSAAISGMNTTLGANELVIYSESAAQRGGANGAQAAIDENGMIVCVYPYGSMENPMPENGFIVSASGSMASFVMGLTPGNLLDACEGVVSEYRSAGDIAAAKGITVYKGDAIGALPEAFKDGYVFNGWLLGDSEANEDTVVTHCGSITLKASYTKTTRISFDSTDGRLVKRSAAVRSDGVNCIQRTDSLVIFKGTAAAQVTSDSVSFIINSDGTVADMAVGKVTIDIPYAGMVISGRGSMGLWIYKNITRSSIVKVYDTTVSVFADGADYKSYRTGSFDAIGGSVAGGLPGSVREGYDFDGWYLDEGCTQPFTPESLVPYEDITLYAGWIQK